tara:strand:- start:2165 stop:3877 length:1713 start_codon:yes stop_codon:yes gene_type:complete
MASTYSANNGMEKPAKGDLDGTWGDMVNENMDIIDRALSGVGTITLSGTTHTLTTTDGATTDGQFKVLVLSGSPSGTNTITISPNDQQKIYFVVNSSGQSAIFTQGSGANVTVPNGGADIIYADGNTGSAAVTSILSKTLTTGNIIIPDAGNIGSASDTDAIAISSGGVVTMNQIPVFSAGINASGGTITGVALSVDDVAIDGKVITMTGSTSDTAVFTAGTNGTLSIVTTDDDAAAANITITADGTFEADGTTVTLDSEGDIVLDANGADILFKDDGTTFGSATNSSGNLIIKSGTTTALTFSGANVTAAGTYNGGGTMTTGGNIVIPNSGYIGSASDTDAVQINSSGNVYLTQGFRIEAGDTSLNSFYERGVIYMGRNQANDNYTDMDGKGIIIYDDQGTDGTTFTKMVVANGTTAGDPVWQNKVSGTLKSEIEVNGDFQSATNSYGATSDLNLKENIVDSGSQWNDIKAMRVRKFSFKEESADAPNMIGVIAQELESAGMDKLVKTHLEFNPADDGGDDVPVLDSSGNQKSHKSVKYSVIHMKALKALQEAMERIEALETKVASLGG